jgi:hypothetical protein
MMRRFKHLLGAVTAATLAAGVCAAQLAIPRVVQLPTQDFVWTWGRPPSPDNPERPDFDLKGVESGFHCALTGSFKPGSHMSDFDAERNFEMTLSSTIYFIEDTTYTLNDLSLSNDLDWAVLNCVIPDPQESEEKQQERVDKALERAERARDRRRERDDDKDSGL